MAVTIDWPTKVINVPRADMLLVQTNPSEIRELDLDAFRLELKSIEDGEGMPFVDTHSHNTTVTVGGVTLARVLEIINGYTITFEDGQYAVNLVGANSNVGDVVNVNQVSVRSANSAGLTYSKEIEDQSFLDGRIFIDPTNGASGTQFPRGTATDPVDNYADAIAINAARGLPNRYLLHGMITLTSEDLTDHDWAGTSLPRDEIALGGSTTTGTSFSLLKLTGAASGVFSARDCVLENVSGFNGFLFGGAIAGTLTLAAGEAHIVNLHAAASGGDTVTIDYNGVNVAGFIPGWEGSLTIDNHSHASAKTAIDTRGGKVTLLSSCTAGTLAARGVGRLVDASGAEIKTGAWNGMTIINEMVDSAEVNLVFERMGLRSGVPVTIQSGSIAFGSNVISITGDQASGYTLTRTA